MTYVPYRATILPSWKTVRVIVLSIVLVLLDLGVANLLRTIHTYRFLTGEPQTFRWPLPDFLCGILPASGSPMPPTVLILAFIAVLPAACVFALLFTGGCSLTALPHRTKLLATLGVCCFVAASNYVLFDHTVSYIRWPDPTPCFVLFVIRDSCILFDTYYPLLRNTGMWVYKAVCLPLHGAGVTAAIVLAGMGTGSQHLGRSLTPEIRRMLIVGLAAAAGLACFLYMLPFAAAVLLAGLAYDQTHLIDPDLDIIRCAVAALGGLGSFWIATRRPPTDELKTVVITAGGAGLAYFIAYTVLTIGIFALLAKFLWDRWPEIRNWMGRSLSSVQPRLPSPALNQDKLKLQKHREWTLKSGAPPQFMKEELARIDAQIRNLQ